jgi:hypothetical protein
MNINGILEDYYKTRGLKVPTFDDAMKFVHTEIGEVYELELDRIGGYIRNNPQDKHKYSDEKLGKELADCIMMLLIAGKVRGVDVLWSLLDKIGDKVNKNYIVDFIIKDKGKKNEI